MGAKVLILIRLVECANVIPKRILFLYSAHPRKVRIAMSTVFTGRVLTLGRVIKIVGRVIKIDGAGREP